MRLATTFVTSFFGSWDAGLPFDLSPGGVPPEWERPPVVSFRQRHIVACGSGNLLNHRFPCAAETKRIY